MSQKFWHIKKRKTHRFAFLPILISNISFCLLKSFASIYIKCFVSQSVCHVLFVPGGQQIVCSLEEKHFSHIGEGGGQTFYTHREGTNKFTSRGGQTILQQGMGTNIFTSTRKGANNFTSKGGQTFLHLRGGDKHIYIKGRGQTFLH